MNTMDELLQWRAFQKTLTYSHIRCFVCDEPMYYGGRYVVATSGKQPIFQCRCTNKMCINDPEKGLICADCRRDVTFATVKKDAIRFRCTCGHTDLCLKEKVDETQKL